MRYIETRAWLRDGAGKIRWWNERKTKESVGMKIGIINGSIRDERNTVAVADFVFEVASQRNGSVEYELVDLRSEEHTSELQSRGHLVCRLLLEKKKEYTR